MNPFAESDLALVRGKFPELDVDAIATRCATRHPNGLRTPTAMLESWCRASQTRGLDRLGAPDPEAVPGMFRADGSWDSRGHGDTAMHRFVDMLVTARRRDYTPEHIANRILDEPELARGFPNAQAWIDARGWWHVPCSTSAEQCVKDAGLGRSAADKSSTHGGRT